MTEGIFEFILIGSVIFILFGSVLGIREWLQIRRISKLSPSKLPVKKSVYCQLVLDWCHENIALRSTEKPMLKVNYKSQKKWGGMYFSGTHECVIYVNSHETIQSVTNSIIHEYVHARQRSKNFDKMYEKYQRDVGYVMNPFEVEARQVAKKYEIESLLWVYAQISKV